MKGRLPPDLDSLFDEFIDQDIEKIRKAIVSKEFTDEAEVILATLLNKIFLFKEVLPGNTDGEVPITKVNAQSKTRVPLLTFETVEYRIKRLMDMLEVLKELHTKSSDLLQKFDDLKQESASSLWLKDLHQLEEYLTVKL